MFSYCVNATDWLALLLTYLQMNLGATVTAGMEGQATPTQSASQSDQPGQGQTYPPQTSPSNQQPGQGQAGPRVIRISHQAVPVVMMQMNTDGVLLIESSLYATDLAHLVCPRPTMIC